MKKIYFASKFNLLKDKKLPLEQRLVNDFRAIILQTPKKLTYADDNLLINNKYVYKGPFYCEQASNGDFTSTDCNVVLEAEYKAVSESDIYFALFDQNFSVGTIVELAWAIAMDKEIIIFYKEEESSYQIKSEYWFAIADAMRRSKNVKVYKFREIKEVIEEIEKGEIFNEI